MYLKDYYQSGCVGKAKVEELPEETSVNELFYSSPTNSNYDSEKAYDFVESLVKQEVQRTLSFVLRTQKEHFNRLLNDISKEIQNKIAVLDKQAKNFGIKL